MGNSTFNIKNIEQFINEPQDGVMITGKHYANSEEVETQFKKFTNKFEEKFNSITLKQDKTEADYKKTISDLSFQIQNMLNEMLAVIGMGLDFLNDEEQRRYESLKHKPDWESTLTFVVPVLDKLGIKIETKTKLENLPKKYRDQLQIVKAKKDEFFGNNAETNELDLDD
jgi:hypothetical protein